ncbi:DUF4625 domain-containing protein [Aureispira anguillae]|uniref:DUF4625 domain-containing protein n=1 Tax=Aureispira anguillae TaxID=2864201 RepID=A0A915YHK3_9BACT|nr:DUF4625 domain-containing protein [Aureispira anguillae]BDS13304.1 DUF4625 domain-containing protein [Aureispira anguillae]
MKNLSFLVLFTALFLGFSACEKTPDVKETVEVTINAPTEGASMQNGDDLNVNVTFTDPAELHNYSIVVTNETDTTTVLDLNGHDHSTSLTIDSTITLSVTALSDFKLVATASNHAGESATKDVHFQVNP